MNNPNLAQEVSNIKNLLENSTIGIILGEGLNQDTAAAGLSLYLSLKDSGKNVQIISKKEPTVEIANLVGINKLKKAFSGDSSRVVVSLPYNRGEIGKVSYKEENNRINFYLTAVEGKSITNYENSDINLIWDNASPSVIFAIGMTSALSLTEFVDSNSNVKVVSIDRLGEPFGDVSIVNNAFSSVSEIVAKVIKDLGLPISIDVAQNLLDGIVYATKNFTRPNTSPLAFELTGVMMSNGAVRNDRGVRVDQQIPQNRPRVQHQTQGNAQPQNSANTSNQAQSQNHGQSQSQSQNPNAQNRNLNNRPNLRDQRPRREDDTRTVSPMNQSITDTSVVEPVQQSRSAPQEDAKIAEVGEVVEPVNTSHDTSNDNDVPSDWLMPKVFKGSQNIDDLK